MKIRKLTALVVLMMAAFGCRAVAQDPSWLTDFEAAKKLAAERKVPILADFSGSDWCGWCIKLEKEVFSTEEFKSFSKDKLVLLLVDFPNRKKQTEQEVKQNGMLSEKYGIQGFPTVLLLDANGKVLAQTGYRAGGAKAYIDHLNELLKEASQNENKNAPGRP